MKNQKKPNFIAYTLEPDSELRFEVEEKDVKVFVTLISGLAELFGTELVQNRKYKFLAGTKVAIFTYHGCVLHLIGRAAVPYISKETPMVQYINCHVALQQLRQSAEMDDKRGPVVMVVGPPSVGKSTLCRILLNYALRQGRYPFLVDLDCSEGVLSIPGTIAAAKIVRPLSIEEGFTENTPLVYHFGHLSQFDNYDLYNTIVSKMASATLAALNSNTRSKHSGIIVNTCDWERKRGNAQITDLVKAFAADVIFVVDQERLYNQLLAEVKPAVQIVLLPKSGGVVSLYSELRTEARDLRIRAYFYGDHHALFPFLIRLKFHQLKIFKIGTPGLPDSCAPFGLNPIERKTHLVAVQPTLALMHHLLSVSCGQSTDIDVLGSNLMGFLCVTEVDTKRKTLTVLSPQPRPLPDGICLLSDVQWMDG